MVSGLGNFGQWIDRLSRFYEEKTGMRLYPGTLWSRLATAICLPRCRYHWSNAFCRNAS